jgi:hypothetical protein
MYFSKVRDPVMQIAITTYNAVTAFVMVFHFLEFMAGLAVKIAVTLLAFFGSGSHLRPHEGAGGRPPLLRVDYDRAFLHRLLPGASGDGILAQDPNTAKTLNEKT